MECRYLLVNELNCTLFRLRRLLKNGYGLRYVLLLCEHLDMFGYDNEVLTTIGVIDNGNAPG